MGEIWDRNEELDGEEELVVTDHRDADAPIGESLDENAPEEELPLAEARALEDTDEQGVTIAAEELHGE